MAKKRSILAVLLIIGTLASVSAEDNKPIFSLSVTPGMTFPMGRDAISTSYGGSANLEGDFHIGAFLLGFGGGYSLVPIANSDSYFSMASGTAKLGLSLFPVEWLELSLFGTGGYFYSFLSSDPSINGHNPYVGGGIGINLRFSPGFGFGIRGAYRNFLGLYNDIHASASFVFGFGAAPQRAGRVVEPTVESVPVETKPEPAVAEETPEPPEDSILEVANINFETIFPVFFKYYDNNSVGSVEVKNIGEQPIENLYVDFFVTSDGAGKWILGGDGGGLYVSTNPPDTWTSVASPAGNRITAISTDRSGTWVAGDTQGRIIYSTDDGVNFFEGATTLTGYDIEGLSTDRNGYWIALAAVYHGQYSDTNVALWTQMQGSPLEGRTGIYYHECLATDGNGVWVAAGSDVGIAFSLDGGFTWTAGSGIPYGMNGVASSTNAE